MGSIACVLSEGMAPMNSDTRPEGEAPHWSSRLRAKAVPSRGDRGLFENKRWAARRKSGVFGLISAEGRSGPIKVAIRDTSSSGALIQILAGTEGVSVDDVPDSLKLVLRNNREYTEVQCVVVRRLGDCLGVRYAGQFNTFAMPRHRLGGGAKGR